MLVSWQFFSTVSNKSSTISSGADTAYQSPTQPPTLHPICVYPPLIPSLHSGISEMAFSFSHVSKPRILLRAYRYVHQFLKRQKVALMSAGLDEAPMAYKDIDEVMAAQADLVRVVARFAPRLVRMASGTRQSRP